MKKEWMKPTIVDFSYNNIQSGADDGDPETRTFCNADGVAQTLTFPVLAGQEPRSGGNQDDTNGACS